jgi:type I restriction enzyme S subunit
MIFDWPKVRLGEVLRQRKEFMTIDDMVSYRRPRVQLHAKGIVVRDEVPGALIKTKNQQVCRAGEFLVAEIDAKVGGFGIVSEDLDGAIVSSHYFLFTVDATRLDRRFLDWFIRTPAFLEQVEAQGSTNYAAIRPGDVLGYDMPLPTLSEQRRIVSRIATIAADVNEARRLRGEMLVVAEGLVLSLHTQLAGTRTRKIGDLVRLDEDVAPVTATESYPQAGMRSFGGGLFAKGPVTGGETTYRGFNRLYRDALVLSQVKGWEGAIAVCPDELDGWFVSPEYRTFRCVPTEARSDYLKTLVRTEWFWGRLGDATRGVGARRERTRPERFLAVSIPMPSVHDQEVGVRAFAELALLRGVCADSIAGLDAMMPAVLDRAFKGEL